MSHRDSNQGACTNSCRWKYNTYEARETSTGDVAPIEVDPSTLPVALLEEETRPGELMPAYEDEHGTYIMNSRDLRAVQHVRELTEMGIDSLKIEGRTKSAYYTARTAQVYSRAIDDAVAGREFDMNMMNELEGLANRGFTEGFYRRHPPKEYQNYERGASKSDRQQLVGEITDKNDGWLTIDVKNKFEKGDMMELVTPSGNVTFPLEAMLNKHGDSADVAPGSGHVMRIPLPEHVDDQAVDEFAMLVRYLPREPATSVA
jgi:putative protease